MQKQEPAVNKLALIWQFLKGSKLYFVLSILAAALTALAERAAGSLSHSALDGLSAMPDADAGMSARMQTAVESALGNVQLVVPLHVDGMKLGEASIRSINAVTKSAGKVLLNI